MIDLEPYQKYGSVILLIMGFVSMIVSGVFFGLVYYTLDQTQTALLTTDCVINNNTLVSSCQDLFTLSIYPFLALKSIFVWLSFLVIFGLILGMLLTGYQSGKSPVLMGFLFLVLSGLTYMSIEVANIYRTLLSNAVFQTIMVEFTVYNRLMLNLPWVVFVVSLFSIMLSIANFQRTKVNTPTEELDY